MRCKFDMVYKRFSVLKNALRASLSVVLFSSAVVTGISTSAMAADPVATKKPVDIAKGKAAAAAVCAGCHMPDGNSVIAQNPILAGQHAAYIEKQLVNFRLKPGAKAPERNNAIMLGFATMLSEDDMRNLGAFYASQTPKSASPKRKELMAAESVFIVRAFRKRVYRLVRDVMALVLRGFLRNIQDSQASIPNTPRPHSMRFVAASV